MTLSPLGDSAMVLTLGNVVDESMVARVKSLASVIEERRLPGVFDVVPAFATVAVFYDPARPGGYAQLVGELGAIAVAAADDGTVGAVRRLEIPVCYGGEFGPDLEAVAAQHHLEPAEVIALHSSADYLVQAIGFVPGFAYLGGLPATLATARRATPRREVPAGSLGIGGDQTGVYPLATPGGWNLIGRTPVRMFDPDRAEPAVLRTGDRVRFRPIDPRAFSGSEIFGTSTGSEIARRSTGEAVEPGVEVIAPGMFTTVQDLGRIGHRAKGVGPSGAVDTFALRLANLLVGNSESAAGLEFTLVGPELYFRSDTIVALGGAAFEGWPVWKPLRVRAGTRIQFGAARHGCRGYLALAGGIAVPEVLGSRSTHVRARLGGCHGRPLRAGDVLVVPEVPRTLQEHWQIDPRLLPPYSRDPVVRVVSGPDAGDFGGEFLASVFTVTSQSDRMGMRLRGPTLNRRVQADAASAPVVPGTVQVPPNGEPIVLLADAQTLGGYPQIAHVIGLDLPLVAQLRPGDRLRFREVSLAEAQEHTRTRERALAVLKQGLARKLT